MSEHLVYHGNDRGEIVEISREGTHDSDEPGFVTAFYYVWVKQKADPEDE